MSGCGVDLIIRADLWSVPVISLTVMRNLAENNSEAAAEDETTVTGSELGRRESAEVSTAASQVLASCSVEEKLIFFISVLHSFCPARARLFALRSHPAWRKVAVHTAAEFDSSSVHRAISQPSFTA